MRVDVYFNIHKSKKEGMKIYSIKNKKTNRVVNHLSGNFFIRNARFVVSEKGRNRVLKEKKKNVHAFIRGEFVENLNPRKEAIATYNPYLYDSFVDSISKRKIYSSNLVYVDKEGTIFYR